VHGSLDDLKSAMVKSGWTVAATNTPAHNVKYLGAVVLSGALASLRATRSVGNKIATFVGHERVEHPKVTGRVARVVQSMPLSTETLDSQPQVLSFEKNNNPLGGRHHFRVFDTGQVDAAGKPVWAVAATHDIGITFDRKNPKGFFLNHKVAPNADGERDLVLRGLRSSGAVASTGALELEDRPPAGEGTPYARPFDGRTYDVVLR
jgi:hypothetical protein